MQLLVKWEQPMSYERFSCSSNANCVFNNYWLQGGGSGGGGRKLLIEANWSEQKKNINFAHECFYLRRLKLNNHSHNGLHLCLFVLYIIQHMEWHFVILWYGCRDWWQYRENMMTFLDTGYNRLTLNCLSLILICAGNDFKDLVYKMSYFFITC